MTVALTHEMSRTNPEGFKVGVLQALGEQSVFGAQMWDATTERRLTSIEGLEINPNTWVSRGYTRRISLGTQPMPLATKDRILFHPERLSYTQEVAYRLLHEDAHAHLFAVQHTVQGEALLRATQSVRQAFNGEKGLTALGSLSFYKGINTKAKEDATELMTMYAWDPSYMAEFTQFLSEDNQHATREYAGLATVANPAQLYDIVAEATEVGL